MQGACLSRQGNRWFYRYGRRATGWQFHCVLFALGIGFMCACYGEAWRSVLRRDKGGGLPWDLPFAPRAGEVRRNRRKCRSTGEQAKTRPPKSLLRSPRQQRQASTQSRDPVAAFSPFHCRPFATRCLRYVSDRATPQWTPNHRIFLDKARPAPVTSLLHHKPNRESAHNRLQAPLI